ncbi:hypothetical protein [Actinomarinicola tropica]|uniref:Uncharacterized protein n=1 Tax=Actinomarinicola tropica TaxID=2789776 RepID=A0A5Q2RJX3_9ACTN|nr:hypothetical protein [Actinomarinicola tropica]QGG94347.1 hypothetical protein GH723_04090 [Actinomarinicola tropica]
MARQPFSTEADYESDPVWFPLEQVARLSRLSARMPAFHPGEFMYAGRMFNARKRLDIYLYKHGDTRRYLNLDAAGHAYEFRGPVPGREDDITSGGRYRRHRSLMEGIWRLDLWMFDQHPPLFRSFPPEEWPSDDMAI